jgi:hypothetical protein
MARASNYSFLFHVTLAAFVSGATVGFLRPDFPGELTKVTTGILSMFAKPAAPVITPEPQQEEEEWLLPSPLLPAPERPPVLPQRPPDTPTETAGPGFTPPVEPVSQPLPPIDLEVRVG